MIGSNWLLNFAERKCPSGWVRVTLILYCAKGLPDENGSPISTTGDDEFTGIYMNPLPPIESYWDDREFLFGMNTINITLHDKNRSLRGALESKHFYPEKSKIKIELKKIGASSYTTEFEGFAEGDTIETDDKAKKCSITFSPQTEKLSEIPTTINGVFNDKFSGKYAWTHFTYGGAIELIEDFLKLIAPDISVEYYCPWRFKSVVHTNAITYGGLEELGVLFTHIFGYMSGGIFNFHTDNYKDALKNILKCCGLFLLFESYNKAVLVSYFDYDLGGLHLPNKIKDYKVNVTQKSPKSFHLRSKGIGNDIITPLGTVTSLPEDKFTMEVCTHPDGSTFLGLWDSIDEVYFLVHQVKRSSALPDSAYLNYWTFLSQYYASYFMNYFSTRRDKLTEIGLNYNFRDKLKHNGFYYLPLEIQKDIMNCEMRYTLIPIADEGAYPAIAPESIIELPFEEPADPGTSSNGFVTGEIITPDGTETNFTLLRSYVPGTTKVYLSGVRMRLYEDYTESGGNEIVFTTPPPAGLNIVIDYEIS